MPLMNVCVYGLGGYQLEAFFAEESGRRTQPLMAASAADLRFGLVAGAKSFGSWGWGWPVLLERCSCQREPCVHLSPSLPTGTSQPYQNIDEFLVSEHYVAQVDIAAEELASFLPSRSAAPGGECAPKACGAVDVPCRLVILESAFFRASLAAESKISATPGTVIAGVDQRHSMPSILRVRSAARAGAAGGTHVQWCGMLDVRPTTACYEAGAMAAPSSGLTTPSAATGPADSSESKTETQDSALLAATVHFTSTGEQFAFLHNLPALPMRPLLYGLEYASATASPVSPLTLSEPADAAGVPAADIPPFCACGQGGCEGATAGEPGPLLALTFYANDPRLPYDQAAWEAGLPENVRETVRHRKRDGKEPSPITTVFQVTAVRPIPVEGSCWCPSSLPMPAPLEQQLREVKKKRSTNAPTTSPGAGASSLSLSPASPASSEAALSTASATHHHSHRESSRIQLRNAPSAPAGFLEKGWCVRPLRPVKPVLPDMSNMDDHGHPPLDSNRTQEVWTCLLNLRELEEFGVEVTIEVPYVVEGNLLHLKGTTVIFSGMLQSSTSGTVLLPVFCPAPESATSTELTSLWVKLYVQYLLVFPLSECAVRGSLEVVRSCDTYSRLTVPTLIGHRGLGRTYTRSSAVCGAAPLTMKCNENTVTAFQAAYNRGCAMVEFDVMLSSDRVPVVIHDPVIELLALKRHDACTPSGQLEHAPVRVEVHKLSLSQLRDLHAQCCKTLGRIFPLKDMLAHHWEGLVRWTAAQRARLTGGAVAPEPPRRQQHELVIGSALMRGEDFPDGVPSLRQVLENTPPKLRFNLEVKYPFQPRWDSNLFLQSDAFEVNGFVDAILRLVFEFAKSGREITFSSFDPNICMALALKQSRYDVFFLSDTKELRDLKDYRSFYVEGAIQFVEAQHLAGISMNAGTLLSAEDEAALEHIPEAPIYGRGARGPVAADFFSAGVNRSYDAASVPSFFGSYGRAMVAEMHRRHMRVWTWGGMNSYLYFAYAQAAKMRVDGVIGDRMPVFSS